MRALAIAIGLALGAPQAAAQTPIEVRIEPSRRTLAVDDFVTIDLRVIARTDGEIEVEIPDVPGIEEVSRSNYQSSSISFVNGQRSMTREHVISIEYVATEAMTVDYPSVMARIGRQSARSRPLRLVVQPRPHSPAASGAPPAPGQVHPPAPEERDVFLRFRASDTKVFVGEQLVVDLIVYARPGSSLSVDDLAPPPAPDGVWREVIEDNPRLRPIGDERIGGQKYRGYLRWRVALFPLDEGDLELERVTASFRSGSTFGRGRRLRRSTRPLRIEVVPLPETGRPDGFHPANVGRYELASTVDETRVRASRGVVLRLRLSGEGNVRSVVLPEVEAVDGFRVFPPTVAETVDPSGGRVRGEKTAEVLLTPTRSGRLEIPSFETWIFDPEDEAYRRLTTETIRVAVEGSVEAKPPTPAPASAEKPPPSGPRWRPVIPAPQIAPGRPPLEAAGGIPALALPWLVVAVAAALRRLRRRRAAARAFDASKTRVQLRAALASGRATDAWAAAGRAFRDAATDRWAEAGRNIAPDEAAQRLREEGWSEDDAGRVRRVLESADFARFAPDLVPEVPEDAPREWLRLAAEVAKR